MPSPTNVGNRHSVGILDTPSHRRYRSPIASLICIARQQASIVGPFLEVEPGIATEHPHAAPVALDRAQVSADSGKSPPVEVPAPVDDEMEPGFVSVRTSCFELIVGELELESSLPARLLPSVVDSWYRHCSATAQNISQCLQGRVASALALAPRSQPSAAN